MKAVRPGPARAARSAWRKSALTRSRPLNFSRRAGSSAGSISTAFMSDQYFGKRKEVRAPPPGPISMSRSKEASSSAPAMRAQISLSFRNTWLNFGINKEIENRKSTVENLKSKVRNQKIKIWALEVRFSLLIPDFRFPILDFRLLLSRTLPERLQ